MIRNVRACKTAAEERGVIAKECANLRTAFKENDIEYRHRNVAKLMFIHMLGYPTHFGQMECLKLIASPGFPEKRIGYLGLMVLLDERQEVLMLVTNSLKNDLNHTNQFIIGLALCALGNICSSEMARDLAPEVERLLNSNNSYIRKKVTPQRNPSLHSRPGCHWDACVRAVEAALCSVRIIRKVPDLAEYLLGPASGLLQDKHHGVLLSGTKLAIQLCDTHPPALDYFRKQVPVLVRILKNLVVSGYVPEYDQVPTLVRILKNLVVSGYAPEYDVGGITDPFLQIRVLRLLRMLGKGDPDASDIMSDILAQVATNTEANKNTGNAILYECVHTIFGVEAIGGLRVLAINILGRFLANRDNNIRYVALHTLIKVVAVDTQAVQRHRNTIVECDSDISIRRRALELVCALVNEGNLKALTRELLDYLRAADSDFKPDLTSKICALVQRYAPSKLYHVEIMLRVMTEAGEYVTDDVIRFLVVLISNAPELQGFAVRSFFHAMRSWKGQESLGVVTVWCLGEYGEMLVNNTGLLQGETPLQVVEAEVVQMLEGIMKDTRATPTLKAYVLVALLKLSCRFPSCSQRIKWLEEQHRHSLVLELQQRSVEFSAVLARHDKIKSASHTPPPLFSHTPFPSHPRSLPPVSSPMGSLPWVPLCIAGRCLASCSTLADKMPALDEVAYRSKRADLAPDAAAPPSPGGADLLLDLLSLGDAPAPPAAAAAPAAMPAAAIDPLAGLMGGAAPTLITPTPAPAPFAPAAAAAAVDPFGGFAAAPAAAAAPSFPGIVALESRGLRITFEFAKDPAAPQSTTISASYTNSSPSPLTDFVFQAAVPKFMQLQLEAASGAVVPASNSGSVTQTMRITNTLHGQKPLVMKLRVSYKKGTVRVLVVALLAVAMAGGAAEARPEGFGRWFVVPALDGEGSYAGACGPRVAEETPACNVSGRSKGHELRSYPDDEVWVTTIVVNASYDKAVEDGTWRLHSFFAGHNARSEPIALTAPVLTMPRPEAAGYEVSLVVPRRYSPESVPQPTDPTVKLVLMPRGVVRAVLGPFGGFPTEAVYGSKLQRLKGLLERRGMGFDESSGAVPFPSPRHRIALVKSPTLPSSPPFPSHPSNATGTPTLSAMVLKTELCRFSGAKIYPGRGIRFIRADSQVFLFVNAKCKQYFHNRLKPSKLDWTAIYRKQHKKDVQAEGVRRKKRTATKVHSRSIVGASLEVIQKRRSEKAEVRAAARDAALREIKERLKKVKDEKKAKKAEVTTKQAKAATKAAAPRASVPKGGKGASGGGGGKR
ncbi:unnamed protein product [Closterium sp. NIES-64]|nr:unnamed protein product [Closterium sp. NIES-64]